MKKKAFLLIMLIPLLLLRCATADQKKTLIFSDDFSEELDPETWIVEMDSTPSSKVYIENKRLILDTEGGVTVWLNKKLEGNYIIEYQRTVKVDDGINDRLSDFNQFWMASDPDDINLFTRKGKFEEYDDLALYYVGVGGNYNSTTRFRKYDGKGERYIIEEKNDNDFLLKANTGYLVKIIVNEGQLSYWMNDICYFQYFDSQALSSGYFGFRSTWSRQHIDFINIYQLN